MENKNNNILSIIILLGLFSGLLSSCNETGSEYQRIISFNEMDIYVHPNWVNSNISFTTPGAITDVKSFKNYPVINYTTTDEFFLMKVADKLKRIEQFHEDIDCAINIKMVCELKNVDNSKLKIVFDSHGYLVIDSISYTYPQDMLELIKSEIPKSTIAQFDSIFIRKAH